MPFGHHAPDRYRDAVIAHLMVDDASRALDFYARAFDAQELLRIATSEGRIVHAETAIQGSVIMVGDADGPFRTPHAGGGASVALHLYVADVDTLFAHAVTHGAKSLQPVQDMFYGARMGMLQDPYGHVWVLLTHREDLDLQTIRERGEAMLAGNEA